MITKTLGIACSVALVTGAALVAPSADRADAIAKYQAVANWPQLPAGIKLAGVTAVATDSADRVYLFHRGKLPVLVFDKEGKFLKGWGDGLVKTAHGLRIDPSGNVWITDIGNHLVTEFDADGKVLRTLGKKDQPGDGPDQFNKPTDVAVARSGEFYVSDGYGNSRVVKFSKEGKYLKAWGQKGKADGEFNLPHAVCLDDKGRVYVGDRENNRVQVFDAEGKFLTQLQQSGAPYGLFLNRDQLFVADGRSNRFKILDLAGMPLGSWGEKGSSAGQFAMPHGICVDSRGAVYVAEVTGQRVQKFVKAP